MKKILVVEDSKRSQKIIRLALAGEFDVVITESVAQATAILDKEEVSLLLLDIDLPGEDGISFFSRLVSGQRIPTIFLTSHADIGFKISTFQLGAVDYIVKPCHPMELLLRLKVHLRDSKREGELKFANITIDRIQMSVQHCVSERLEKVDLSPTEFKLLLFFVEHQEQLFTRNQIFDHVWGVNTHFLDRTVDRHVSSLRRKIPSLKEWIEAVYGVGYICHSPGKVLSIKAS